MKILAKARITVKKEMHMYSTGKGHNRRQATTGLQRTIVNVRHYTDEDKHIFY